MAGDHPHSTLPYPSGPPATAEQQPDEAPPLAPGTRLGRYVLGERLGAGGMGVVYAAHDPELHRPVALKLLRADLDPTEQAQARLLREAQAMARLSHPNVVAIHDVGQLGDRVFVAAELIDGPNLRRWLEESPRSWREVVRVYIEAGRGLCAMHAAGLVHRDFKPDNVLVARDGRVRVADFGLARPPADEAPAPAGTGHLDRTVTRASAVAGTPAYMSPEQRAQRPVDARSDQYSFAASLYESLHGRLPGEEGPGKPLPRRLRRIVDRALAEDPRQRHPALGPMLDDLGRAVAFRWRRWLVAAAVAAALALAWPAVRAVRSRAYAGCLRSGDAAAAWSPALRERLAAAFLRTGLPFAPDSVRQVDRSLRGELAAWSQAREAACADTHLRRSQPPVVLAAKLECLDDRLREARTVVDLLSTPDAHMVEAAADVLSALPPVATCTDAMTLLSQVRTRSPATEARRVDLRQRLLRLRALNALGRYGEGLRLIGADVAEARQLGDQTLEAEALLVEGQLRFATQDYPAAERVLLEAMAAAEASRHEEVRVRAGVALAEMLSEQHQNDRAAAFLKLARAALGRLPSRPDLEGRILFVEARTLDRDPRAAFARAQEALARFEASVGPDSREVATVENMVGWMLGAGGQREKALVHLRRSADITRRLRGTLHPHLAITLGNLAITLQALGRTPELRQVLEEQLKVIDANYPPPTPPPRGLGEVHAQLAAALWVLDRLDEGRSHIDRALELIRATEGEQHPRYLSALITSGAIHLSAGQLAEARAEFERSVRGLSGGDTGDLGRALLGLGAANLFEHHAAAAVAPLERAHGLALGGLDGTVVDAFLGRALVESGRDRARGRQLLAEARPTLAAKGSVELAGYHPALGRTVAGWYEGEGR